MMPNLAPRPPVPRMTCPKCGFEQDTAPECRRCGIIIAKFRGQNSRPSPRLSPVSESAPGGFVVSDPSDSGTPALGLLTRVGQALRILRWVSLGTSLIVVVLILRQAPPLPVHHDPQAAEHVAEKLVQLEEAARAGTPRTLRLNEAELNHWLRESLALADAHRTSQALADLGMSDQAEMQEVQSGLKDLRIKLQADLIRAQAFFEIRGKTLSLQLDGHVSVINGQLQFQPTAGRLGSLPLPKRTLDGVVTRLRDSPQNRAQFQLPAHVQDLRVQNGEWVITYR